MFCYRTLAEVGTQPQNANPLIYLQMYLGYVPLLSKGDFSLYYGGVEIIPLLSDKSGSLVTPVFMGSSLVFQLSFLIFKRIRLSKLKPKTTNSETYFSVVYSTLLTGFRNTFTIIAIVIFTASGLAFTVVHYQRIEARRSEKLGAKTQEDIEKIPFSVYLITAVFFCLNIAQFLRNDALRMFARKKIQEFFQVDFRKYKHKPRKSNRVFPTIVDVDTPTQDPCEEVATNPEKFRDHKPETSIEVEIDTRKNTAIARKKESSTQMKIVELPEVDI